LGTGKIQVKGCADCRVPDLAALGVETFFYASVKRLGLRKKHLNATLQTGSLWELVGLLFEAQYLRWSRFARFVDCSDAVI